MKQIRKKYDNTDKYQIEIILLHFFKGRNISIRKSKYMFGFVKNKQNI